jgi:4a-hydroxytetrahydrobiopterin dehydratase
MSDLIHQKCVPCEGGIPPLNEEKEEEYLREVEGWSLERDGIHRIKKEFYFDNFLKSIEFVNKVADVAEKEGHHPDIYIFYDKVVFELHTHAIKGLHKNDFIIAAKIDKI